MTAAALDPWPDDDHARLINDELRDAPDDDVPDDDAGPASPPGWVRALLSGGTFVLDGADSPEPLWGRGSDVLLADGEALMLVGGQGLGKSTLAQQLALGRVGLEDYDELLGYPIQPGEGRTLYLAMDRPRQIARSFRRMLGDVHRDELDDRLVVWPGPPPYDLARYPGLLADMASRAGADTVVVDSLKDAAVKLTDDEIGAGWNRARQTALRDGVQVVELHHNRKKQQQASSAPGIDDVYGSTWLTSGAGSVLLLTGHPGDPIVLGHHVKQPAEPVGPLRILHDHAAGRSSVHHRADLIAAARARLTGITAKDAACVLFETDNPSRAEVEKARRKLDAHVAEGKLRRLPDSTDGATAPARWAAT